MVAIFTDEETSTLEVLNVLFSSVSFIGSLFIISVYLKFPELHTFAFKLVFFVSVNDLFVSLAGMLGDEGNDATMCFIQGVVYGFFELASMLWSVSIAFTLWRAFIKGDPEFSAVRIQQYMPYYIALCWGIPLVLTLLPMTTSSYGDTGGWCWIKDARTIDHVWRFVQWYIPLLSGIIFNAYVYYRIQSKLKIMIGSYGNNDNQHHNNSATNTLNRMKYYPLVLIVCNLPGGMNAVYQLFTNSDLLLWLNAIHISLGALQGFCNAVVYGLTPQVLSHVKSFIVSVYSGDDSVNEPMMNSSMMNENDINDFGKHDDDSLRMDIEMIEERKHLNDDDDDDDDGGGDEGGI